MTDGRDEWQAMQNENIRLMGMVERGINEKIAEIARLRKALSEIIDAFDYCSEDPADRGYAPASDAIEEGRALLASLVGKPSDPPEGDRPGE